MTGRTCLKQYVMVSGVGLVLLFSVHCLHSDPIALSYINIKREKNYMYILMAIKLVLVTMSVSVCLLFKVDTRGRSDSTIAKIGWVSLLFNSRHFLRKDLLYQVLLSSFNFNAGRLNLNVHSYIKLP